MPLTTRVKTVLAAVAGLCCGATAFLVTSVAFGLMWPGFQAYFFGAATVVGLGAFAYRGLKDDASPQGAAFLIAMPAIPLLIAAYIAAVLVVR